MNIDDIDPTPDCPELQACECGVVVSNVAGTPALLHCPKCGAELH